MYSSKYFRILTLIIVASFTAISCSAWEWPWDKGLAGTWDSIDRSYQILLSLNTVEIYPRDNYTTDVFGKEGGYDPDWGWRWLSSDNSHAIYIGHRLFTIADKEVVISYAEGYEDLRTRVIKITKYRIEAEYHSPDKLQGTIFSQEQLPDGSYAPPVSKRFIAGRQKK